ncbi:universal stress protein [Thiotrichales bacterium 19S3-7]|nr:universal stress protein [Thiotrichales bacterium 19S3-7]MCF6800654.1 universal stress protein [Thiotrichales bacterium 19S3-11]
MLNHKNILYAVEIDDQLGDRIKKLIAQVGDQKLKLHVYHVVKTVIAAYGYNVRFMAGDPTLNIERKLQAKAETQLKAIFCDTQLKNVDWSVEISDSPKAEIIDKAKEINADAIYLNGHNHNVIARLGSVADYVINHSDKDVVILKS